MPQHLFQSSLAQQGYLVSSWCFYEINNKNCTKILGNLMLLNPDVVLPIRNVVLLHVSLHATPSGYPFQAIAKTTNQCSRIAIVLLVVIQRGLPRISLVAFKTVKII